MSSPTIGGMRAGQTMTDQDTVAPFAGVTISDDASQTETLTVALSNAAQGSLSSPSGAGSYDAGTGVYTDSGSAQVVSTALEGLVFTPAVGIPGSSQTTGFTITATDTSGGTATDSTTSVVVTSGPSISGTQANQALSDQASTNPFEGVTITDDPGQDETVTVTLSDAANGTLGSLGGGGYDAGTGIYTVSGTPFAVTSALNHLAFTPAQGMPGDSVTTTFAISDTDTAGASAADHTTSVIATGGPSISGTLPDQAISDQATINPFSGVTIADDAGQTETATVTLSAAGDGTLSNLDGGTYDAPSGTYSISGSASAVTAALDGLVFTPAQGTPGQSISTGFTITATDAAQVTATDSITSVVVSSGPAIAGALGGQATTDQSVIFPFYSIVITDDVGQTETVTITLSDPAAGVLGNTANGSYNTQTGVFTDTGTAAAVTDDIDGLVFIPALGSPGQNVETTFTISDTDTAGATASDSTTTVTASSGPAISGTLGGQTAAEGATVIPFGDVTITDDPGQTEHVTITLSSAAAGTLSNLGGGSYSTQTGVYTDTGTADAVTADIDQLLFTPASGVSGGSTTTFTITDEDSANVTVTDDATTVGATSGPSISGTASGQATTDQTPIQPFSNVVIADSAGQTETVTITLSSAADGTLTNIGGGSFAAGVYTDAGSAEAVTADIDQLVFVPSQGTPGQSVTTTFFITATDGANASVTDATTTVTASAGPSISGAATTQATTNQAAVTPFAGVSVTDDVGQTETLTVSFAGANGTLGNLGSGSYDAGVYTDAGTAGAVTADLQGLVFTPAAGAPGESVSTVFTIRDTDSAGAGATPATTSVTATTGPAITGSVTGQTISDHATVSPFAGVTIADGVGQTETVTVSFNAANGTLGNLGNGSYDAGVYTDAGTAGAVTADLQGLVFTPAAGTAGQPAVTTTFTISDIDSAAITASDGTTTVIAESGPAIGGTMANQFVADDATINPFADVTITDDAGQTETVSVAFSAMAGTLGNLGNGSYDAATGVYGDTGSAAAVQADLRGLIFSSAAGTSGQPAVTTAFRISDTDSVGLAATDGATTVTVESGPAIAGIAAGQTIAHTTTLLPFKGVTIADDVSQTETVTVTLSSTSHGSLGNFGAGSYNVQTGVYAVTGSAGAVTAALDGLVFTPASGTPGQPAATTAFRISDTDTAGLSATDGATTVTVEAGPAISPTLAGQSLADSGTITPLAGVTVADDVSQTQTVTVTLSSTSHGSLGNFGAGSYNAQTGVYAVTGSAGAVTAALDGLVFTPAHATPGTAASATSFTVHDTDTAGLSATSSAASVLVQSGPAISGVKASQTVAATATLTPFSLVSVADDVSQTDTVTVAMSSAASGSLGNLGGGSFNAQTGIYTVSGSAVAVTAALQGLVFTPGNTILAGGTLATGFTIAVRDTVGLTASNNAATVLAVATSSITNEANGTSFVATYNPAAGVSETIIEYSGHNGTGTRISETVNNTDGSSLLYSYKPTNTVSQTTSRFSGPNDSGSRVSEVVDDTNGQSIVYAYNPTQAVTLTAQTWSATNAGNGAPAGNELSEVVDNTNGTSLLYGYNPSSTVRLTAAEYSATDTGNGAPSGTELSDVVDETNGTAILYAYDPAGNVTMTATFYSGSDPGSGAPGGMITREVFDYTNSESAVTTYGQNGAASTLYYSGPDGTGSRIPALTGTAAGIAEPAPATGLILPATPSTGTVITASNQLVDPGTGNHTILFASGAANDTLALHLGAVDQVQGFETSAADTLSLGALLGEAHLSLGGDIAGLGGYISVTAQDGDAAVAFDPTGQGGGSRVALLLNDAAQVPQLQTLREFTV